MCAAIGSHCPTKNPPRHFSIFSPEPITLGEPHCQAGQPVEAMHSSQWAQELSEVLARVDPATDAYHSGSARSPALLGAVEGVVCSSGKKRSSKQMPAAN